MKKIQSRFCNKFEFSDESTMIAKLIARNAIEMKLFDLPERQIAAAIVFLVSKTTANKKTLKGLLLLLKSIS